MLYFSCVNACGGFSKLVHISGKIHPSFPRCRKLKVFRPRCSPLFCLVYRVDTSNSAWKQAQLSLSRGGIGLRGITDHSTACYIASLSMSGGCSTANRHRIHSIEEFNKQIPGHQYRLSVQHIMPSKRPLKLIGRQSFQKAAVRQFIIVR